MIGRPETGEADPYYFTYINQVPDDEVLGAMERQLPEVLALYSGISEEKSQYRYATDKWSIREVLNHVADTERAMSFRALWFARGFDTPLPSYDQHIANRGAEADRIPWEGHVEEFRCVRQATMALFRHLPQDAWMRNGIASDCPFTVRSLAFIIVGHVTHHNRILRERYL